MNYSHSIILHPYTPTGGVVGIDPVNLHGYWEYKDGTEGGELTFSRSKGRLCLEDYDGSYELPWRVTAALRHYGIEVGAEFDPLPQADPPEDRPSPSFMSARESAIDEQAAHYDDPYAFE